MLNKRRMLISKGKFFYQSRTFVKKMAGGAYQATWMARFFIWNIKIKLLKKEKAPMFIENCEKLKIYSAKQSHEGFLRVFASLRLCVFASLRLCVFA